MSTQPPAADIYQWADREINACPRYETGFTQLLAANPYRVSPAVRRQFDSRLASIQCYQQTALDIFRAALKNEIDPAILHWLINETPASLGISYHRSLEERHFTLPVFFRSDEVRPGVALVPGQRPDEEAVSGTVNVLCSDRYTDIGEGATYQSTYLEVAAWGGEPA